MQPAAAPPLFPLGITAHEYRVAMRPRDWQVLLPVLHDERQRPTGQFGLAAPHREDFQRSPRIANDIRHRQKPTKIAAWSLALYESKEERRVKVPECTVVDCEVLLRLLRAAVGLRRKELLHGGTEFSGAVVERLGRVEHHDHFASSSSSWRRVRTTS